MAKMAIVRIAFLVMIVAIGIYSIYSDYSINSEYSDDSGYSNLIPFYIASLKKSKKREEMIEFTTKINIFAQETYVISCHLILYGMVFVGISFEQQPNDTKMNEKDFASMIRQQEAGINTQERERSVGMAFGILMRKVYTWMALALVITSVAAFLVAKSDFIFTLYNNSGLLWGLIIAELALVFGISAAINKLSLTVATLMFLAYSVINGITLSSIFMVYDINSIGTVFLITAASFAGLALVGYTTKKDLSGMGKFLIMGLIGIIIATLVNLFFIKSSGFDLLLSYAGVVIFAGLTVYDTQKIKEMCLSMEFADASAQKLALLGALTLYLDFINLFLYLLRIFGRRN